MALFHLFCASHVLLLTPGLSATALSQRAAPPGSITIAHGLGEDRPCSRSGLYGFSCALKSTASGQGQGQPLWNMVLCFSVYCHDGVAEKIRQTPRYSLNCLPLFSSSPGTSASKHSSLLLQIKKEKTPDAHTLNKQWSRERKGGVSSSPLRYLNSSFCPAKIFYLTHTHPHTL